MITFFLLTNCQSSFSSVHSTLTALLDASNARFINKDNGFIKGIIFIDLKKSFDTIYYSILFRKLACSFGVEQQKYLVNGVRVLLLVMSSRD